MVLFDWFPAIYQIWMMIGEKVNGARVRTRCVWCIFCSWKNCLKRRCVKLKISMRFVRFQTLCVRMSSTPFEAQFLLAMISNWNKALARSWFKDIHFVATCFWLTATSATHSPIKREHKSNENFPFNRFSHTKIGCYEHTFDHTVGLLPKIAVLSNRFSD